MVVSRGTVIAVFLARVLPMNIGMMVLSQVMVIVVVSGVIPVVVALVVVSVARLGERVIVPGMIVFGMIVVGMVVLMMGAAFFRAIMAVMRIHPFNSVVPNLVHGVLGKARQKLAITTASDGEDILVMAETLRRAEGMGGPSRQQ